jgi:uncharacterized membrane protein
MDALERLFPDSYCQRGHRMRGPRQISTLVCSTLLLAACSRQAEPPAAQPSEATAPASAATTELPAAPAPPEPPADSGLSIKRGIAMLAQDRTTFRPCGEKAELWLLDQSDGLQQTFADEMQKGPAMLYVEAYGERAPVSEDIAEARAYAGTFILEELLYAGAQGEVRGCDAPAASYIVAARGGEPFWAVEVGDGGIVWRQPEEPKEISLGPPQTQDAEGAVRYHASGNSHELELLVDAQTCRDPMSGEFFAYSARAVLDGKEFNGCARVGR